MQRAAVLLVAVLMTAPLGAASPQELRFRIPADFEGDATASGTWVALLFGSEGAAQMEVQHPSPTSVVKHAYMSYEMGKIDEVIESNGANAGKPIDSTMADVGVAGLRFRGSHGSLLLNADSVELRSMGVKGQLSRWEVGASVRTILPVDSPANPYWFFHGGPNKGGTVASIQTLESAPFEVAVHGLRSAVWFGADVACTSSDCPTGGRRDMTEVPLVAGGWVAAGAYSYEEATFDGGTLVGNGTLFAAAVLGPALDLAVHGSLRLPLASGSAGACAGCVAPEGQTLHVEGNLALTGISSQPDGTLRAALHGDVVSARFDETAIDPAHLAGVGGAAALAGAAIAWLLKPFLTPLFTRMTKEEAMDHPNRRKLYDAIQADPGIGFREVARRAGLAAGTARHHLNVLARHGLVQEERHRFTQRFFPASVRLDAAAVARGVLLREPQLARLQAVVEANAWITQSDLIDLMAREVGWTRSTTQHRLARLVAGGLVQVRQQGRFQLHAAAGTVHPQDAARSAPSAPPAQPLASQYAMSPKPSTV